MLRMLRLRCDSVRYSILLEHMAAKFEPGGGRDRYISLLYRFARDCENGDSNPSAEMGDVREAREAPILSMRARSSRDARSAKKKKALSALSTLLLALTVGPRVPCHTHVRGSYLFVIVCVEK